jgi:hypothetical protein
MQAFARNVSNDQSRFTARQSERVEKIAAYLRLLEGRLIKT